MSGDVGTARLSSDETGALMQLLHQAMELRDETLADIGCGPGELAATRAALRELKQRLKAEDITAVGFSADPALPPSAPPVLEPGADERLLEVRVPPRTGQLWRAMAGLAFTAFGERELFYRTGRTHEELETALGRFSFS
ncbi:hypothetical protein ACIBCM_33090 [Streptomyces sp. NPDC051018]|uniref:hypothetical protein n=1 Tax=Streptomyces sp. NPDC051018 TaxID=3365639 RepID=UPI00378AF329